LSAGWENKDSVFPAIRSTATFRSFLRPE